MRKDGDYGVGYGKPPVHTRFKRGRSGNGKGRPKIRLSELDELIKVVSKKVRLPDGTRITKFQAGIERLKLKALQGDLTASALIAQAEEAIKSIPAANPCIMYIDEEDVDA